MTWKEPTFELLVMFFSL